MTMVGSSASIGASAALLLVFACLWKPVTSSSAAGTETLVGIQGRDFVILGADSSVSQSIALTASNLDKIAVLVDPFPDSENVKINPSTRQQCIVAAVAGDAADADRLVGTLTAHAAILEYQAGVGCDVDFVDCRAANRTESAIMNQYNMNTSDRGPAATPIGASTPAGLSVQDAAHLARHLIASRLRSSTPLKVCLLVAGMMPIRAVPDDPAPSTGKGYVHRRQALPRLVVPSMSAESGASRAVQGSQSERVQQQVREATMPTGGKVRGEPIQRPLSDIDPDQPPLRLDPRLFWLDEYGSIQRLAYGAHGYGSNFALSILDEGYRSDLTRERAIELMKSCFDQLRVRYVINSPQPPCIKCVDRDGCHLVR